MIEVRCKQLKEILNTFCATKTFELGNGLPSRYCDGDISQNRPVLNREISERIAYFKRAKWAVPPRDEIEKKILNEKNKQFFKDDQGHLFFKDKDLCLRMIKSAGRLEEKRKNQNVPHIIILAEDDTGRRHTITIAPEYFHDIRRGRYSADDFDHHIPNSNYLKNEMGHLVRGETNKRLRKNGLIVFKFDIQPYFGLSLKDEKIAQLPLLSRLQLALDMTHKVKSAQDQCQSSCFIDGKTFSGSNITAYRDEGCLKTHIGLEKKVDSHQPGKEYTLIKDINYLQTRLTDLLPEIQADINKCYADITAMRDGTVVFSNGQEKQKSTITLSKTTCTVILACLTETMARIKAIKTLACLIRRGLTHKTHHRTHYKTTLFQQAALRCAVKQGDRDPSIVPRALIMNYEKCLNALLSTAENPSASAIEKLRSLNQNSLWDSVRRHAPNRKIKLDQLLIKLTKLQSLCENSAAYLKTSSSAFSPD